jgi:hypothetical protein
MEQKDYLLREIDKIGLVLRAMLNKLYDSGEKFALTTEDQFIAETELLYNETGISLEKLIKLNVVETRDYLAKQHGMNTLNIELLADVLKETGMKTTSENSKNLLMKAADLYSICNSIDKTFSFERERKISEVLNQCRKF